ncbi:hypothetical protein [Microcoleus sp. S13_C3]
MYTYTAVQLQAKIFGELKSIARELDVVPSGDRRCRQAWIDVIVGVELPLLLLIETFPGVETDSVQEAIAPAAKTSPGVEVELVQEPITLAAETSPGVEPQFQEAIAQTENSSSIPKRSIESLNLAEFRELTFLELLELCRDTDKSLAEKSLGQLQNLRLKTSRFLALKDELSFYGNKRHRSSWIKEIRRELTLLIQIQSMMRAPRGFGRVEESLWDRPIDDFDALLLRFSLETDISALIETSPGVEVEPVQEPIVPVAETFPGVTFSDRFLARYFPPHPEIHYQADADGQLNLLDFEIVATDEPPDPDDFDSLDDFFEAMAAWDAENLEPVEVSLDSMVYWAPCPSDWYEPPDTGIFVRLPGPKPPKFPPQVIEQTDDIASVSSSHSGRSPPGGDAVF